MHFCKSIKLFEIWLDIWYVFGTKIVLYSIDQGLLMLHGKTMKFIVFFDPSIVIFLWQCKLVNVNLIF